MITIKYIIDKYGIHLSQLLQKEFIDDLQKFKIHCKANETRALDDINFLMWQTWGLKDVKFDKEDGEKIMQILNDYEGKANL